MPLSVEQSFRTSSLGNLLERIFKDGNDYRKAGIILSGLVPAENTTKRLFDDERFKQQHNLMKVVDEINQKFGKDTVRFASVERNGAWKMKQIYKSPWAEVRRKRAVVWETPPYIFNPRLSY